MSQMSKVQLRTTSILNVPLQIYSDDFTFVVNGKEHTTTKLISDLISTKISQIHSIDPTFNRYTINTQAHGDFSHVLQLIKFNETSFPAEESEFLYEIICQLGCEHYDLFLPEENIELTTDNVFTHLKKDKKYKNLFKKRFLSEIEFISSHFSEFKDEISSLDEDTIISIINNPKFQLKDEDDLLKFVNILYKSDKKYSILYEKVIFENVTSKGMIEFIDAFDYNDINHIIWSNISERFQYEINRDFLNKKEQYKERYSKTYEAKKFTHSDQDEFNGIIKYLTDKTGGNIHDNKTIEVTSNSISSEHPKNLLDFNQSNYYKTQNAVTNAWICFDFKNYEVEISDYSIKSYDDSTKHHIKNWLIEISNDGKNWSKIDEHSNYSELRGANIIKTFKVSQNKFSRFCRFRHTGDYWGYSAWTLRINSIEFYGNLKEPKSLE